MVSCSICGKSFANASLQARLEETEAKLKAIKDLEAPSFWRGIWCTVSQVGEHFNVDQVRHGEVVRGINEFWSAYYHCRRIGMEYNTRDEAKSAVENAHTIYLAALRLSGTWEGR